MSIFAAITYRVRVRHYWMSRDRSPTSEMAVRSLYIKPFAFRGSEDGQGKRPSRPLRQLSEEGEDGVRFEYESLNS